MGVRLEQYQIIFSVRDHDLVALNEILFRMVYSGVLNSITTIQVQVILGARSRTTAALGMVQFEN